MPEEIGKNSSDLPKDENQQDEVVKIPAQVYNELLDQLEELQESKGKGKKKGGDEIEDLLSELGGGEEEKGRGKKGPEEVDLDQMSNKELASYLEEAMTQNALLPLMTKLQLLEIKLETNDLRSKYGEKDPNFDEILQEAYKVNQRATQLSLEEAYELARSRIGPQEKGKEGERGNILKKLPPKVEVPIGEKPGAPGRGVSRGEPKSLSEAADRAWEEVVESKK